MTKIEWTNMAWNPSWGCRNNCEYCYARKIAKRFARQITSKEYGFRVDNNLEYIDFDTLEERYLEQFHPIFLYSNFHKKFPNKPSRIFVNSMSDIAYWKPEWMEKVLDRIREYPQHTFQFLTKVPEIYFKYIFPGNCWLGITATDDTKITDGVAGIFNRKKKGRWPQNNIFLSIEPITGPYRDVVLDVFFRDFGWIIIGAETGNRKDKVIPKRDWIDQIVLYCGQNGIPVFLKDNLKSHMPQRRLLQQFPEVG